ncbi:SPC12-domain-containing protein [Tricholoma matsutake]|nr:SPC12-domain-containing protein [Tricholoma matsutake 945]
MFPGAFLVHSAMSFIQELTEGKIDFTGQQLVDKLSRYILITVTVVSFFAGFIIQSLTATFGIFGAATALTALLVIPPWPMYNSHPVKWLPVIETSEVKKSQ